MTDLNTEKPQKYFAGMLWSNQSRAPFPEGIILFGQGIALAEEWYQIAGSIDGNHSYVIADWVEENRDELLAIGNTLETIDAVITAMKKRGDENR